MYTQSGSKMVWYKPRIPPHPIYGKACMDSMMQAIEVIDIKADFTIDTARSGPLDLQFLNRSTNAETYIWSVRGLDSSDVLHASMVRDLYYMFYPNKGRFEVCLKAINSLGCEDELCQVFELDYPHHVRIPNVFTPGTVDGFNDAFDIDIEGEIMYELSIFNRHSQLVYKSSQDGFGRDGINWDGTNKAGMSLSAGVYYVVFDFQFEYEEPVRYTGTVTLIR